MDFGLSLEIWVGIGWMEKKESILNWGTPCVSRRKSFE